MRRVLKDIMVTQMSRVIHVHVLKQTKTLLEAATYQSQVWLATAKKATQVTSVIDALKVSSGILRAKMVSVKVVTVM